MAAYTMDITIRSNADWCDSIALWLPDTGGMPSPEPFPIDPTWKVIEHLRSPNEELIPSFVLSSDNGRLMIVSDTDTAGNVLETRLQWNVPRAIVQFIPAGNYSHDIKFVDPDGGEFILAVGTVTMITGTTRP